MQAENEAADAWRGGAAWANAAMIRWVRVLEKGVALLKRLLITAGIVVVGSVGLSMLVTLPAAPAAAADTRIARGKYLVGIAGCNDCHTPGYFFGKPDMARFLSGSEVGFEMPGLGVFYGPNLTPDRETGLGTWSRAQMARGGSTSAGSPTPRWNRRPPRWPTRTARPRWSSSTGRR